MMTSRRLLEEFDRQQPSTTTLPTGFRRLDDLTGGFDAGQVWIVTGAPGQGVTTLLTQWAAALAGTHGWQTWLACPREDTRMCTSRLISCIGKVPLNHLVEDRIRADDTARAQVARELMERVNLHVAPQGHDFPMPAAGLVLATVMPFAAIIDDADLVPFCSPTKVRDFANAGGLVVLSLPRDVMLADEREDADLNSAWARVADVVLEVRSRGLTPGDPEGLRGDADLTVLKHRRGPTTTAPVTFEAHYARFVDLR